MAGGGSGIKPNAVDQIRVSLVLEILGTMGKGALRRLGEEQLRLV
jgi:hypothetical protein